MLNKIEEFVDHLSAMPDSELGLSPAVFYKEGIKFGLTCVEVRDNFLGKSRAFSPGKYLAIVPSPAALAAAATKPASLGKRLKKLKSPRTPPKAATQKAQKKGEFNQVVSNAAPIPDTSVFTYIATPAEISEA